MKREILIMVLGKRILERIEKIEALGIDIDEMIQNAIFKYEQPKDEVCNEWHNDKRALLNNGCKRSNKAVERKRHRLNRVIEQVFREHSSVRKARITPTHITSD